MKNGTSQAVLVADLFATEGPYSLIADDFVAQRCSLCSADGYEDMRFSETGFFCPPCGALYAR